MPEFLAVAITLAMILLLIRAAKGPRWYHRVLVINSLGSLIAILLCVISVLMDFHALIDIALLYVLINFISVMALLRFFSDLTLPVPSQRSSNND